MWQYPPPVPGQETAGALRGGLVVAEGKLFAALGRRLVAIQEERGAPRVLWEQGVRGSVPGSPVLGSDGRLRLHSGDGLLHCFSLDGGAVWPPLDVDEPLGWAAPLVDEAGNTYVCSYHGGLLRVDPRGAKSRSPYFRTRQKFDSTGLIHQGILYVGAEDGFVYAIRLNDPQGTAEWDSLADQGKTEWFINSAPALASEGIVVAGRDEYLYQFDFTGACRWKVHLRGQMLASPIVDPAGDVYVGVSLLTTGAPSQGRLVCVGGKSQRVLWEYRAEGAIESTPVLGDDGILYVGDNHGTLHAVDAEGRCVWKVNVGSPIRSAGNLLPGRVVFGTDRGSLAAVACSSQSLPPRCWPKHMGPSGGNVG